MSDADQRFGGITRLYGVAGVAALRRAHVAVIGIGGVGSWAVEALARSGVGRLTLVDLDEICVTNINRQLHAVTESVGRAKVEEMAARVGSINPNCTITACAEFFTHATADAILDGGFDFLIDAIDSVSNKCLIIAACRVRKIPMVTCGAAGGRRNPTAVRAADLAQASHDRLLAAVRKKLRQEHGLPPAGQPCGVRAVFSVETPILPDRSGAACVPGDGPMGGKDAARLNCNDGLGSATFVTGTFGFVAVSEAVRHLTGH